HLLIGAALVLSMRWPVAYAFLVLTKVAPGVTALWWAVRREWRNLVIGGASAAAVVAVSFAINPGSWFAWIDHISSESNAAFNLIPIPLIVRLPFAAAVAIAAGLSNRSWLLPFAAVLALPLLWVHGLAVLVAVTPLYRARPRLRGHAE
ncbi:MAG: glycosyltransferase 87 family protein, partial [Chloroflexota bacterium]